MCYWDPSLLLGICLSLGPYQTYLLSFLLCGGSIPDGANFTFFRVCRKLGDHTYLSWNNDQPSTATASGRETRPGEN